MYSGRSPSSDIRYCKYSLPFSRWTFHSLNDIIWWKKYLILMKSNSSIVNLIVKYFYNLLDIYKDLKSKIQAYFFSILASQVLAANHPELGKTGIGRDMMLSSNSRKAIRAMKTSGWFCKVPWEKKKKKPRLEGQRRKIYYQHKIVCLTSLVMKWDYIFLVT